MKRNTLLEYYEHLLEKAKDCVDGRSVKVSDVLGLQMAVDVIKSVINGSMGAAEADAYVNEAEHDTLPGIAWARKAAKRLRKCT